MKWLGRWLDNLIYRFCSHLKYGDVKLRQVIDTAPIGICICDRFGDFIETNTAYEKMTGYSKEELKGMSFFDITHPNYRPENKKRFKEMLIHSSHSFKMEKVYIRKDKTVIDVGVHATTVEGRFGTAFVEDITEHKRMLDRLVVSEARCRSLLHDGDTDETDTV